MAQYLSLLPAVFARVLVLCTLLLRVCMRARWRLKACSRACLSGCLGACMREPRLREPRLREPRLRDPRFGRSRVFHGNLLPDGKLWVCWCFDANVHVANLLVSVLLVLWSPSPTPLPSPSLSSASTPSPSSPSPSSPSAPAKMCIHTPTTRGKQAAYSAGKSELEICSPQDPIVYHSYWILGCNCQRHGREASCDFVTVGVITIRLRLLYRPTSWFRPPTTPYRPPATCHTPPA